MPASTTKEHRVARTRIFLMGEPPWGLGSKHTPNRATKGRARLDLASRPRRSDSFFPSTTPLRYPVGAASSRPPEDHSGKGGLAMLNSIPDQELVARLEELRRHERASCVEILQHLNEIERRSLHLRRGYSSLF